MILVEKKVNSNKISFIIEYKSQKYIVCEIIVKQDKRKISEIILKENNIPNMSKIILWNEALAKGKRIHDVLNKILIGKSYRDFLLRSTSSFE